MALTHTCVSNYSYVGSYVGVNTRVRVVEGVGARQSWSESESGSDTESEWE